MFDTSIKKGDTVRITCGSVVIEGVVDAASNWGSAEKPNWYLQYTITKTNQFRYRSYGENGTNIGMPGYWKQGSDGGSAEVIAPAATEVKTDAERLDAAIQKFPATF